MVEDEAPFLAGNGKQTLDLSPIKIVKVRHELFPNDRVSKGFHCIMIMSMSTQTFITQTNDMGG